MKQRSNLVALLAVLVAVSVLAVLVVVRHERLATGCLAGGRSPAPGGTWCPVYREDFDVEVGTGAFTNTAPDDWYLTPTNPYAGSLRSYPDGWPTTGDLSLNLSSRTAEVVDAVDGAEGVFRLNARTELVDGRQRALGGSFYPVIRPGAQPARDQTSQRYGRYTVRFRTHGGSARGPDGPYPTLPTEGRYGTAFLLWPADDRWADGEVDFPEMGWGERVQGHVHEIGRPDVNSADFAAATTSASWGTATIEWSPGLLVFLLDGTEVYRTSRDVPSVPMRWGYQSGAMNATPAPEITGQLLVDWVEIEAYVPEPGSS